MFLLFVLTLPFWLTPGFLYIQKEQIKYKLKEKLKQQLTYKDFETLRFSRKQAKENLEWEHDSEFEYNGYMYDVIRKTVSQDSVSFVVWKDDDETKINQELDNVLQTLYSQPDPIHQGHFISFIKTLIYQESNEFLTFQWGSFSSEKNGFYHFLYSDPEIAIASPPPQFS